MCVAEESVESKIINDKINDGNIRNIRFVCGIENCKKKELTLKAGRNKIQVKLKDKYGDSE